MAGSSKPSYVISRRLALLGWLPLLFGVANALENWHRQIPHNILWLCHVSDFALALGLLLRWPALARLAVLNLIAGCALWIRYSTFIGYFFWVSGLAHLGGTTVGLVSMRWLRASRGAWVHAFLFMLATQVFCYLCTAPAYDINLSHRFFTALLGKPVLITQPRWLTFLAEAAYGGGLFLINRLLVDAFPPDSVTESVNCRE